MYFISTFLRRNNGFKIITMTAEDNESKNRSWGYYLLTTFVATTISIVLTFGTASLIEYHRNIKKQKEMAIMIIHDIDVSIDMMKNADSLLTEYKQVKESFDLNDLNDLNEQSFKIGSFIHNIPSVNFPENIEKIFSSNSDVLSTLGDMAFIDNVTLCYNLRRTYLEQTFFSKLVPMSSGAEAHTLEEYLDYDVSYDLYMSKLFIHQLQNANRYNMEIMKISEKDIKNYFTSRKELILNDSYIDSLTNDYIRNLYSSPQ